MCLPFKWGKLLLSEVSGLMKSLILHLALWGESLLWEPKQLAPIIVDNLRRALMKIFLEMSCRKTCQNDSYIFSSSRPPRLCKVFFLHLSFWIIFLHANVNSGSIQTPWQELLDRIFCISSECDLPRRISESTLSSSFAPVISQMWR